MGALLQVHLLLADQSYFFFQFGTNITICSPAKEVQFALAPPLRPRLVCLLHLSLSTGENTTGLGSSRIIVSC